MPLLGPAEPLPQRPHRVVVAGTSGSGKTALAAEIARALGVPHVEIDALFHGADWSVRPSFEQDVRRFSAEPAWVTEWQYGSVRAHLADVADLLVWLDLTRSVVMRQVIRRTLARRLRRTPLWNGNVEPPLWTFFTDREHIVRWAWTTHHHTAPRVQALLQQDPDRLVVRLRSREDVVRWLRGPLSRSSTSA